MDLREKVCLVTGGTRGIGGATAVALAKAGAAVVLLARRTDSIAAQTRQEVEAFGRRCVLISADVGKPDSAASAVNQTIKEFGALDVLVHSAGGLVAGGLLELAAADWYRAFDVHVHAIFHLCRVAIPHMKRRGEGAVVLVSSVAGIRGLKTNVAYQTVKGALPQLTRALAYEFADDNIRVNCVAPGVIRTEFHAAMPPEVKQLNLEKRIPLHREGTPAQVASLILEVISNDYITGQTMTIDGGLTMRIC